MDDYIPKIDQNPAILRRAFDSYSHMLLRFQSFFKIICQRVQHTIAGTRTDYKIIGEVGNLPNIQQQDILSFLFLQYQCDPTSQLKRIQISPPVNIELYHFLKPDEMSFAQPINPFLPTGKPCAGGYRPPHLGAGHCDTDQRFEPAAHPENPPCSFPEPVQFVDNPENLHCAKPVQE